MEDKKQKNKVVSKNLGILYEYLSMFDTRHLMLVEFNLTLTY